MKVFSVGGSVRDELLGLKVKDHDFLVINATRDEMIKKGFLEVGKSSFPVFLHPKTRDEYALAALNPYFLYNDNDNNEELILKNDLLRRDLTINTLLKNEKGEIIDYFNGINDLREGKLKHVSAQFRDDPIRAIRVARLLCRYHDRGFKIDSSTLGLIKEMVSLGELDNLAPERVLLEIYKACTEKKPSIFFETLRELGVLKIILPEVNNLFGVQENVKFHPEADSGIHTMMVVDAARSITNDHKIIFAALLHDLGKGLTKKELWPKHHGHESSGVPLVESVCDRLKVDKKTKGLCVSVCLNHLKMHRIFELRAKTILDLLQSSGGLKSSHCLNSFSLACEADFLGRDIKEKGTYHQKELFKKLIEVMTNYSSLKLRERGYTGIKLGEMIIQEKIKIIKNAVSDFVYK